MSVKIVADSITTYGKRITTFELEYPRFIHSEVMTHRVLSKNSSSSRAIPFKTMLKFVWSNPAGPIYWGKNKPGMRADEELTGFRKFFAEKMWYATGKIVCGLAWIMSFSGVHKRHINRMLEPWSYIKIVCTGTEWDNFFHLRCHEDAQPELRQLALEMREAIEKSTPKVLKIGEWHLPYMEDFNIVEIPFKDNDVSLDEAKMISVSLCAQVSYRKQDFSIDKAKKIYSMLIDGDIVHASPFEHIATPSGNSVSSSGNFKGWIQYRQQIPNNYFSLEREKTKKRVKEKVENKKSCQKKTKH